MIPYESLVMKELCPELSEVMDTMIRSVNYIKTCPLKAAKWGHNISHSCFTVILIGCQGDMLWLVFTTCEQQQHCI
jgi:hypothetical protein